jgi:hypothetical protein
MDRNRSESLYLLQLPNLLSLLITRRSIHLGPVAGLVGIEGGVVSGVINLESSGVSASDRRPRHDERYHEA